MIKSPIVPLLVLCSIATWLALGLRQSTAQNQAEATSDQTSFLAGAAQIEITPQKWPVIVNGMFTERIATKVVDRLWSKAIVLKNGETSIALVTVDSCMVPRAVLDQAKAKASEATGIPVNRMCISATHTHSAPSAMGCLGSRLDADYAARLPEKIAASIIAAQKALAPAEWAHASVDAWSHTFNRRWIRRPDRMLTDPFGQVNVRANMHPGHESPDAVGPSGPVDPQLGLLALRHRSGKPLAAFANFSMHYVGSDLLSSDYFGAFADQLGKLLKADDTFIGIMSQGTSGDLASMDYGGPAKPGRDYKSYAQEMAAMTYGLWEKLEWKSEAPLRMEEEKITLNFRQPTPEQLEKSYSVKARLGEQLPQTQPDIYALEALYLHERPRAELIVQALSLGDLTLTTLPNEVFCLTGLKLKAQSPAKQTMVISLANGAEGYIPPPEQHALGGYTTWPARTAGLVAEAEPALTQLAISLIEKTTQQKARSNELPTAEYTQHIIASRPLAYWRLNESTGPTVSDMMQKFPASLEPGIALYLPGVDDRRGFQPPQPAVPNRFSGNEINRAIHVAGGRVKIEKLPLGTEWTVTGWFWNGLPSDARPVTGYLLSHGEDGAEGAPGEHIGIGGTDIPGGVGRLFCYNGNQARGLLTGHTRIPWRQWHHLAVIRRGDRLLVYLNGSAEPEIDGPLALTAPPGCHTWFLGGRNDGFAGLEGKLDEFAVYDRALSPKEITQQFAASGLPRRDVARTAEECLETIQTDPGVTVSLVAAEPLIESPCALAFDPSGALYVAENRGYPSLSNPPLGRIARLIDKDKDGRYETRTTFADGLTFPNGVLWWKDGLIVTCAPDVFLFKDTNRDGIADERHVVLTGFATEASTQLRVNDPTLRPDGWIYFAGGLSGGAIIDPRFPDAKPVKCQNQDIRWNPETGALELIEGKCQWGHEWDELGQRIICMNRIQAQHVVLDRSILQRNPKLSFSDTIQNCPEGRDKVLSGGEADAMKIFPISDQKVIKDAHQGYFSAAGGILRRGNRLLTCDPSANLIHSDELVRDGATWIARRSADQSEFVRAADNWFRPVFLAHSPDGDILVADMPRQIIDHPEYMPGEVRKQVDTDAGRHLGRIWRIKGGPANAQPSAIAERAAQLAAQPLHAEAIIPFTTDNDPAIRFRAAIRLGDLSPEAKTEAVIAALAAVAMASPDDRWTRAAVLSSVATCGQALLEKLLTLHCTHTALLEEAAAVADHFPEVAKSAPDEIQRALILGLKLSPTSEMTATALSLSLQSSAPLESRIQSVRLVALAQDRTGLLPLLSSLEPAELQQAAAKALGSDIAALFTKEHWATAGQIGRQMALDSTITRDPISVLNAIEQSVLPASNLSASHRKSLQKNTDPSVKERVSKLFETTETERGKVYEQLKSVLSLKPVSAQGREVFARACATCHRLDRAGFAVGPDLFDIRNQDKATALYHIIVPDGEIYQGFQTYRAATKDGRLLLGVLSSESATSITLKMPMAVTETLRRSELTSLTPEINSLMPNGLEQTMTPQELANLLAYLKGE